jgi:hypothetical protein
VVAAVLVAGCGQDDEAGDATTPGMTPDAERDEITVTDVEYRAEEAGDLPSANAASVDGVALPTGHVIEVDRSYVAIPDEAPPGPVAWVSDEPVPEIGPLWSDLAARFPETGLWPIVLEPVALDDNRRWWDGELDPTLSRQPDELDGVDFESTLSGWWSDNMPSAEELEDEEFAALLDDSLAPIGRTFPGVAPPPAGENRPHTTVPGAAGHLGLVPVERPADAPAVMGWTARSTTTTTSVPSRSSFGRGRTATTLSLSASASTPSQWWPADRRRPRTRPPLSPRSTSLSAQTWCGRERRPSRTTHRCFEAR